MPLACTNCGTEQGRRLCNACRGFLQRTGYPRPGRVIVKAAKRHEAKRHERPRNLASKMDLGDIPMTMTREAYLRATDSVVTATCGKRGCEAAVYAENICKGHHDLVWARALV